MKKGQLTQMSQAAYALYLVEHRKISGVLKEEAALRQQLARLDAQIREARNMDTAMQNLGADILWRGWQARTREDLNTQLAGVMVRKLAALEKLRRAFGRQQAAKAMANAQANKEKSDRAQVLQERLIGPECLQPK